MGNLTAAKVKSLWKPGRYGDGGTLFLYVTQGGSKSWIQRLTIKGRRRDIGLGGYPLVSLREARDKAFENRKLARSGGDPIAEKRRARTPTFRQAAQATFEANKPRWRNAKVASNWMQQLERHAFKRLGDLQVDQIRRDDVLAVLTPIWTSKPETARRVRRCIKATLRWGQAHGYIEHNMAGEAIDGALPSMRPISQHLRSLPYQEVHEALVIVEESEASLPVKLCFKFLVLTAARSGEARGARWDEIDSDAQEWRIPDSRMKSGTEHRVPLSNSAMDVLKRARTLDDGSGQIFPSPSRKGKELSDMALTKVLRDNGLAERTTVHGLRSTFRVWASEQTDADHAVMELSLAHSVGSAVEQAYARSDLLAQRRELLSKWGAYVTASSG
jgi:integrase